jgi:hypothetical protein
VPPDIWILTEFMPLGSLYQVLHDVDIDLNWCVVWCGSAPVAVLALTHLCVQGRDHVNAHRQRQGCRVSAWHDAHDHTSRPQEPQHTRQRALESKGPCCRLLRHIDDVLVLGVRLRSVTTGRRHAHDDSMRHSLLVRAVCAL